MTKNRPIIRLKDFMPYRLSVLSNRISNDIAALYQKRFSLTIQEWRVIAVLGEEADLSAASIAERTAMDKVAVSRAVKSLLATEHLIRHFSEDDRRRSVIKLSEKGSDIYKKVAPLALKYEQNILKKMTKKEQATLQKIIKKLEDIQLHIPDDA